MSKKSGLIRAAKVLALLLLGSMSLGSSCAEDIRYNIVQGGLSYVKATAVDVADTLFPVADWLDAILVTPAE